MMSGGRAASRAAVLLSRVARAGARTRLVGRQLRSTRLLAAMPASAAHPSLLQRRTTTPCTSVLRAIRLSSTLTTPEYHKLADAWLDAMHDTFEDLIDGATGSENYDVSLSNGVLTLALDEHGTYVINKQTPNKQIWFSSPTTGPKRYDWVADQQAWVYSHDGIALHKRLADELGAIFNTDVDVTQHLHL